MKRILQNLKLDLDFFHQLREGLKGAVDFKIESEINSTLRFGCNYKVDSNSSLKARLLLRRQEEMRLGLVYNQKLSTYSCLSLSADLNTRKLISNDASNDHRFWLSLKFGDD